MTRIKIFRLDTFTNKTFSGNPAVVCPLPEWLPEDILQNIAAENNSETAFIVGGHGSYHIRWFTPVQECNLSAHTTLAASKVIRDELGDISDTITYSSLRGELIARYLDPQIELTLPTDHPFEAQLPDELTAILPFEPVATMLSQDDWLVEAPDANCITGLDLVLINNPACTTRGIAITAKSDKLGVDFVSRYFGGPGTGIIEDPVNASVHSALTAYWAEKLDRVSLYAKGISSRGGDIQCQLAGDRVLIRGQAVSNMSGEIRIPGNYFLPECERLSVTVIPHASQDRFL